MCEKNELLKFLWECHTKKYTWDAVREKQLTAESKATFTETQNVKSRICIQTLYASFPHTWTHTNTYSPCLCRYACAHKQNLFYADVAPKSR